MNLKPNNFFENVYEVVKLIQPATKIKDETISGLLQYIDLIDELNNVHK